MGDDFSAIFAIRKQEADEFYRRVTPFSISEDMRNVQRQAFAGMLWCKQYYHYIIEDWLKGDTREPMPPSERKQGRNQAWFHLYTDDILSMCDKWEYPWCAAWDLAFHCVTFATIDPDFAKYQLDVWNEEDGFYYDVLHLPDNRQIEMKVRSLVGLIPLFAVEILEPEMLNHLPNFKKRMEWFIKNRPDLRRNVACLETKGMKARRLLAIVSRDKLQRILQKMLDESEFFSDYGIRAVSRHHAAHPYHFQANGMDFRVDYEPAESTSGLFGGNSNWRGPIWFPVNFLLIESLQKFHRYFGDDFKVECPTGSGQMLTMTEVATELSQRLTRIFLLNSAGNRPVYGSTDKFQKDPHWRDLILFYEYFHGDNGAGIVASHQTGWTGLVAQLIQQLGEDAESDIVPKISNCIGGET